MDEVPHKCTHTFEERLWLLLEEVYGNAQWALRYGATKESLLNQIEQAVEVHEDSVSIDGWLIRPDGTEAED